VVFLFGREGLALSSTPKWRLWWWFSDSQPLTYTA